jgi:NADH-quinone oxidoreductase subunit G
MRSSGGEAIVIAGPRLADGPPGAAAAGALAMKTGAGFASVPRRANDRGALQAGLAPELLPGGRRIDADAERGEVEAAWGGPIPWEAGRATADILRAAADREIEVLFLVGVDPLRDHPDAALARRALENVRHTVVQGLELGELEPYTDLFLSTAAFMEKDGHYTDWEGRGQRLRRVRPAPGIAQEDWEIFAGLARAMEGDLGFATLDALQEEFGALLAPREIEGFGFDFDSEATPAEDASSAEDRLVLFSYPLLVDEGRLSERAAELKDALGEPAFVEVNPRDAGRIGLAEGARAVIATDAGEAVLPVRVTERVVAGSVFVPFNQPGLAANTLLSGAFTAPATLAPAGGSAADDEDTSQPASVGGES